MNKKKNQINKNQAGFTLIELLLSMALIGILTASMVQIVRFSETEKNLTLAKNQVRQSIRTAQSYSLAIPNKLNIGADLQHICGFGFHVVDTDNYELFYTYAKKWDNPGKACSECLKFLTANDDCGYEKIAQDSKKIPEGVELTNASDQNVFFKAPYGDTSGGEIKLNNAPAVSISSTGLIQ